MHKSVQELHKKMFWIVHLSKNIACINIMLRPIGDFQIICLVKMVKGRMFCDIFHCRKSYFSEYYNNRYKDQVSLQFSLILTLNAGFARAPGTVGFLVCTSLTLSSVPS